MSDEWFIGSEEMQKESFTKLWDMVCSYSERDDRSPDEKLRLSNIRYSLARFARVTGHMDRSTFDEEAWRNTQVIAEAMGGIAFRESSHQDQTAATSEDIDETDVQSARCTKPATRKKVFCFFPTIVYVSRHVPQGKVWFEYAWYDSDGKHYISKEDLFSESDYLP